MLTPRSKKILAKQLRELLQSFEQGSSLSPRSKKILAAEGAEYLRSLEEPDEAKKAPTKKRG